MSGGVSVARHGTVLAEARTRVFDVVALEDFTTIGMLICFEIPYVCKPKI
jgi:hypothetical protein